MKNKIKNVGIVAMMVAVFTACGAKANEGGQKDSEIKLGSTFPLTGQYSNYGISTVNGIKMAIDEINENGGIKGKKIVLDSMDAVSYTHLTLPTILLV